MKDSRLNPEHGVGERIPKGTWVRIHRVVLPAGERAPQVPEDTQNVPLEMWVKGYLKEGAYIGETVEIITLTGRKEHGNLIESHPTYHHDFGDFVPEILEIDRMLREEREAGDTSGTTL